MFDFSRDCFVPTDCRCPKKEGCSTVMEFGLWEAERTFITRGCGKHVLRRIEPRRRGREKMAGCWCGSLEDFVEDGVVNTMQRLEN